MPCRPALTLGAALCLFTGPLSVLHADEPTPAQAEFFEHKVRPILVKHCYECHSRGAKRVRGELYLDTREGVRQGGSLGPAVVPGDPAASLLVKAVRHADDDLRMPPKAKLSAAEIADLTAWVKMGAPDPRDGKSVATAGVDINQGKQFWSFRPVQDPKPPAVRDSSWPLNDIDRFVLAALEAKGLRPVGLADPRTLLRRLTFDLTGLPPTLKDIADFELRIKELQKDTSGQANSPNLQSAIPQLAIAELVDRLLASPHYGERWGRHWLDVVRYADTAGDNSDYPIPQMYLYRDWVIDAFNKDVPYDRFVRAQLAGDLLPAASDRERRDQLIATGYLANSRRHGSYEDKRYPWHLTIEDTIDNVGKAFLGLTVNCARCHDHKFDPLTIEDYYALYGFFSSTRYPWPGIELDRVQRDLVPLASPAELMRAERERQKEVEELTKNVTRLEREKAAREKALNAARGYERGRLEKQLGETVAALKNAQKERDRVAKQPPAVEMAYAVIDGRNEPNKRIGRVGNVKVQLKGDPDYPGKEVPRRFPAVLGGQTLPPDAQGSGRLQLADWLTDPANPLTARVMVNRVWQHHFGRGLVATPNNFGKQGQLPSHPELLDHLARRFVRGGWSVKNLHRLILLSRTYQLAGRDDDANARIDPENVYLWRFGRQRLDAESIRDALLAVSGGLDRTPGGPHPFPEMKSWDFTQHKPFKAVYDSNRRSVYLMTQRIQRHPFLALFDGPDTNASTATRTTSTTPLQALFLMNNPFVHDQARKFAARLLAGHADEGQRLENAFLLAFGRPPTAEEQAQARDYLLRTRARLVSADVPREQHTRLCWESLARALFLSSEFVYVN